MLIDDVTIKVKAGNGGNGSASFRRNAQTARGGPDGGNGGKGGDMYIQSVTDMTVLQQFQFKKSLRAEDGIKGDKKNLFGRKGSDLTIKVPVGTRITDTQTGWSVDIESEKKVLIARGGKGGRGNTEFKSSTNQAPKYAEEGELGEEKQLRFELRLIADIGLIGLPNAGKSSLLKALTNADPKIGNYPFTTLEPNLGVMPVLRSGGNSIVLADIPGLIEGASQGKGLGIKFLKHIEKTKLLVHCVDSTSEHILRDYETFRKELETYSTALLQKKEIVLLTKIDLLSDEELKKVKAVKFPHKNILSVSVYQEESVKKLYQLLLKSS